MLNGMRKRKENQNKTTLKDTDRAAVPGGRYPCDSE